MLNNTKLYVCRTWNQTTGSPGKAGGVKKTSEIQKTILDWTKKTYLEFW